MSFSQVALLVVGAFLIVLSQVAPPATVTLVAGIAVCVLVIAEVLLAHSRR